MRTTVRRLALVAALSGGIAGAQEFSADLITRTTTLPSAAPAMPRFSPAAHPIPGFGTPGAGRFEVPPSYKEVQLGGVH